MHGIDWARMAKPQPDRYDTIALDWLHPEWLKIRPTTEFRFADGNVAVVSPLPPTIGGLENASYAQVEAWAPKIDTYLSAWDDGYVAVKDFLDIFYPLNGPEGQGCTSGHVWQRDVINHEIYVSVNDVHGCAQGVYHEVGHLRLHLMGIHMEDHDGMLLRNAPTELYHSSVRFDIKRPMTAVLHGVYAWLMFTENDYQLAVHGRTPVYEFRDYAARNVPKIEKGMEEIQRYAKWTIDGEDFFEGLQNWADDLTLRCKKLLAEIP